MEHYLDYDNFTEIVLPQIRMDLSEKKERIYNILSDIEHNFMLQNILMSDWPWKSKHRYLLTYDAHASYLCIQLCGAHKRIHGTVYTISV